MKINESNKQRIHDVLITDLQRRIFKQYNARKKALNHRICYTVLIGNLHYYLNSLNI